MGELFVNQKFARLVAALEVNTLLYARVIPAGLFSGAQIPRTATVIHDVNGSTLFYRFQIRKAQASIGYIDIAASAAFGYLLLRVGFPTGWSEMDIVASATSRARTLKEPFEFDSIRFVAYSCPKIAVQFLKRGEEVLMLDLGSWTQVPGGNEKDEGAGQPELARWSRFERTPQELRQENQRSLERQCLRWGAIYADSLKIQPLGGFPFRLNADKLAQLVDIQPITTKRQVSYCQDPAATNPCFKLHAQTTNVWCAAASTQMILDFYRYNYDQARVADELGLGTATNPNALPYGSEGNIVATLQTLTSNALAVNMTNGNWSDFVQEIEANRPLISFVSGHVRAVAGYIEVQGGPSAFRALTVYDPLPVGRGERTIESYNLADHTWAYTAKLQSLP